MTAAPSPFDALVRLSQRKGARIVQPCAETEDGQPIGKAARCIELLRLNGSMTTLSLAVEMEIETNHVWGLLKWHRDRGRVSFADGRWSLNRLFEDPRTINAVAHLRRLGWTVAEPVNVDVSQGLSP